MSAGRQLYLFVMGRSGKAFEAKDWDHGVVSREVQETWEREARRILAAADGADEVTVRAVSDGVVHVLVDVDDAVRSQVVQAVSFGIAEAFSRHRRAWSLTDHQVSILRSDAVTAALAYLFGDDADRKVLPDE